MEIATKIKEMYESKGYSMLSFSKKIEMPYNTFRDFITGVTKKISIDSLVKISQELEISLDELTDNEIKKESPDKSDDDEIIKAIINQLKELPTAKQLDFLAYIAALNAQDNK